VSLRADTPLCFGGSEAPAAHCELVSFGGIDGTTNASVSKGVVAVLNARLGITGTRCYIHFVDAAPENMGYDGATF
jgi:hypothetical protein